jgi:hypothetical protein
MSVNNPSERTPLLPHVDDQAIIPGSQLHHHGIRDSKEFHVCKVSEENLSKATFHISGGT